MKVDISHTETTTGLFSKKTHYVVNLAVTFSEEEKAIIAKHKLNDVVVLERGVPSDRDASKFKGMEDVFDLRIGKLTREMDSYAFATPGEAKEYDAALRAKLPELKEYIMGNAEIQNKNDSFEL